LGDSRIPYDTQEVKSDSEESFSFLSQAPTYPRRHAHSNTREKEEQKKKRENKLEREREKWDGDDGEVGRSLFTER
jgi:hypothetical protein